MPITNKIKWQRRVEMNTDDYGKACVDVARRVMEILDDGQPFNARTIISRADKEVEAGGITGFMAGCVAQMVSQCHSRGEEFRRAWNVGLQIRDEGVRANEGGGVLNPALLSVTAITEKSPG